MVEIRRREGKYCLELSIGIIYIEVKFIGKDVLLSVWGGDEPHIGGVILSLPRPSLYNDGTTSSTSSVLNVMGHKDEVILRQLSERCAAAWDTAVVCAGGFHVDGITEEQIKEVYDAVLEIKFVYSESVVN